MPDSPRVRRLKNDLRTLEKLREESSIFDFTSFGSPAERYAIEFHGHGLYRPEGSLSVELRQTHSVLIQLGSTYPRMLPDLSWRTPIFHPNISASGHVCLGGYGTHWVPSITLDELCHMLWDMIRYANYDINSPYNREAAQWVKSQGNFDFPVDPRPLRDRVASGQVAGDAPAKKKPATAQPPRGAIGPARPPSPAPPDDVVFVGEVVEGIRPAAARQSEDEIMYLN